MTTMTAEQFMDVLIAHEFLVLRMQGPDGVECPAFTSQNPKQDLVDLLNELTNTFGLDTCCNLAKDARSIGKGSQTVFYFPALRFPKEQPNE